MVCVLNISNVKIKLNRMNSQPEKCHKCSQIPDDILMLACNHDLCLLCAAKAFSSNKNKQSDFFCELCGTITELDASSVYELEKIYIQFTINEKHSSTKKKIQDAQKELQSKSINLSSEPKLRNDVLRNDTMRNDSLQRSYQNLKVEKENHTKGGVGRHSVSNYSQKSAANLFQNQFEGSKARGFCPEHPEEEILYFCFDCLSKCICPECIIHGIHKNHEVKTIKKSYPIVRQIFEDVLEQNGQVQIVVDQQRDEVNRKQNYQNQTIDGLKTQVNQEFQLLHQVLNVKEQQLLEALDSIPKVIYQYTAFLSNCDAIEKQVELINDRITHQLASKEEHSLLNFYSDFQREDLPKNEELQPQNEVITNHKIVFEALREVKQKLETVQLEIKEMSLMHKDPTQQATNKLSTDILRSVESKKKLSQFLQ